MLANQPAVHSGGVSGGGSRAVAEGIAVTVASSFIGFGAICMLFGY